ncbi:MAG: hypothetical protein ABI983_02160 [Acidobacteriota bacterium]
MKFMKLIKLDDAIDDIARRMTQVEDDDQFAQRIVGALPERRARWYWMLAPGFALALLALVVLRSFNGGSTGVLHTENASGPIVAFNALAVTASTVTVEPSLNPRRTIVEPSLNDRRTYVEPPDYERSLPALEALDALSLPSLAPPALPDALALTVEPLAIAPLAMTGPVPER